MDYVKLESNQNTGSAGGSSGEAGPTEGSSGSTATALTGKVTSSDVLRIRGGAGTSYAIVGFLNPGEKVTITEQKTVGSSTWGKVAKGWVSMDYIKLEGEPEEPDNTETPGSSVVKTVNVDCLIVRGGAGTSYGIVGYLYKGSATEIGAGALKRKC